MIPHKDHQIKINTEKKRLHNLDTAYALKQNTAMAIFQTRRGKKFLGVLDQFYII